MRNAPRSPIRAFAPLWWTSPARHCIGFNSICQPHNRCVNMLTRYGLGENQLCAIMVDHCLTAEPIANSDAYTTQYEDEPPYTIKLNYKVCSITSPAIDAASTHPWRNRRKSNHAFRVSHESWSSRLRHATKSKGLKRKSPTSIAKTNQKLVTGSFWACDANVPAVKASTTN